MKKSFLLGLMALLLPLTTWAADEKEFDVTVPKTVTYNGDNTSVTVTVKVGETPITSGYSLFYYLKGESETWNRIAASAVRNVGNYKVEIVPTSDDYMDYATVTKNFEITPCVVTSDFKLGTATIEYGQPETGILDQLLKDAKEAIKTVLKAGDEVADFTSCLKVVRYGSDNEGTDVNEDPGYTVILANDDDATSNYKYERPETGSFGNLKITAKGLDIVIAKDLAKYNARPKSFTYFKEHELYEITGVLGEDEVDVKEFTCTESIIDAGSYTMDDGIGATLEGAQAGNYKVNSITLDVAKAELKITKGQGDLTKVYDFTDEDYKIENGYTISGYESDIQGISDETKLKLALFAVIKGTTGAGNVLDANGKENKYDIKLYQNKGTEKAPNYVAVTELTNYTFENPKDKFTITPKSLGETPTWKAEGFEGTLTEGTKFTYEAKDYADAANIDLVKDLVTVTYTASKKDSEPVTLDPTKDYDLVVVAYQENGIAKDAGEKFTIAVKGKGNYKDQLNISNNKIEKAELTIEPKDAIFSKVYDGKDSGDIAYLFDFDGLKEGQDEETEIWNTEGVLTMRSGATEIGDKQSVELRQPTGKRIPNSEYLSEDPAEGLKNYIVHYNKVDFTVLDNNLVLDRLEKDDEEAGTQSVATKLDIYNGVDKVNVVLGGDREIKADYWYTLVLPFNTTVREISNAFGYAIVDVPNTANTNPDVISFRLKVDSEEIEANTLILFKTDKTINLKDVEEKVSFAGKKINYDPEFNVTDGDNVFQGVYTETTLDQTNQYYLTQGVFHNLAEGQKTNILPLGGYVYAKSGIKKTILVEDPNGTTAIDAITGETIYNNAEGWYTVGGMKLNGVPTQKGVYINNGKKVVVK